MMKKSWEYSVHVDAPVSDVYELVADFNRNPEWDQFTKKVELTKAGDANGIGAEWKIYEQMGLFSLGESKPDPKHLTGLAKRLVREVKRNERVAWHTHPVPNIGISAEIVYTFSADGDGTRVRFEAIVSVPGVLETVGRLILRNLDDRQHNQWKVAVDRLKDVAEEAHARQLLSASA
jgi:uncharacterized membrane protein